MTAKDLRNHIGKLNWDLDFYRFVETILEAEPRERDPWQKEMWENFKQLTQAVGRFDDTILSRLFGLTD